MLEEAEFYNITSLIKLVKDKIRERDSKTSQVRQVGGRVSQADLASLSILIPVPQALLSFSSSAMKGPYAFAWFLASEFTAVSEDEHLCGGCVINAWGRRRSCEGSGMLESRGPLVGEYQDLVCKYKGLWPAWQRREHWRAGRSWASWVPGCPSSVCVVSAVRGKAVAPASPRKVLNGLQHRSHQQASSAPLPSS